MTADEEARLDKETQAELARLRAELADVTAGRAQVTRSREKTEAENAELRAALAAATADRDRLVNELRSAREAKP